VTLRPRTDEAHPPSHYAGYTGYDTGFLPSEVPLPVLTDGQRELAAKRTDVRPGDDPTVLPYPHFSVVMNAKRSLAFYTAVNIDGATLVDLPRRSDRWFLDPRIAETEQIGEDLYERNALDRGHLVRRLDPVWGDQAQRANDDTFHFTNCSPQHERFNQSDDLWQGLENYILSHAEVAHQRISVFTGPVLADTDPLYKGVRLPLAFWKIVVHNKASGELAAAAYILEQGALIEEFLKAAVFQAGMYRVALAHLIDRIGLDFGYLSAAELPLGTEGEPTPVDRVPIGSNYAGVVL
jgi:endonuclease G